MNFEWNENTVRWYEDAERHTGFFKNIAELVGPKLAEYSTLCDIGCGIGMVDLELSRYIDRITCIDIHPYAIETLKKSIQTRNLTNITPLTMDCNSIEECWDVIFISFFGSRELEQFLSHCKKLIAVVGRKSQAELYPEKYRRFQKNTAKEVEEGLIRKGIPYSLTETVFEFGQPFRSEEEARNFVRTQSHNISPHDLENFITERLVAIGKGEFSLYLPRQKPIGVFEIEGKL
ncbi:methyltransferase family protein [Desulfitobacterium dehalogenans ATCC 51507]|uniref:Methyltransferase family protein n=1 Tax=Desulfitobacterium dehalogenans (strain ATCC 51507 / DSM 9161 / JW/IU-DC1) TaxID=756499 RepID=I4AD63_DESDJ|nr:class I SAM-dependent methyltransferase [Desulfitobacterium dehalogenans]AFM01898.1 methyltransferase family protein [Desulfitobacterium dehalogenans ATCC 51507]